MAKYIFLNLETRDGEHEYDLLDVYDLNPKLDAVKWAEEYCANFWTPGHPHPPGEKNDEGWYEFDGGSIWARVKEVREISKEHYDILKTYL